VQAAATPELLKVDGQRNDLRRAFCRMVADHADFSLALVQHVRRLLKRTDHHWIVQKYLRLVSTADTLTDGEIALAIKQATGTTISTATVKKARQALKGIERPKQVSLIHLTFPDMRGNLAHEKKCQRQKTGKAKRRR
jgi:hypothetical protein